MDPWFSDGWEEVPVWERQQSESDRAFAAFVAYRDIGPLRSLRRAASIFYEAADAGATAAKVRQVESWSATGRWVARAAAYDRHVEQVRSVEQAEAIKEMCRRHADLGAAMVAKAAERIEQIDPAKLSVRGAVLLMDHGAKLERIARGEPSVILEQSSDSNPHPSDYARAVLAKPRGDRVGAEDARPRDTGRVP